jgi:hypothetical protein
MEYSTNKELRMLPLIDTNLELLNCTNVSFQVIKGIVLRKFDILFLHHSKAWKFLTFFILSVF